MNVNVVSKGVVINFIMIISVLSVLIAKDFSITEQNFTLMMISGLFIVGIYIGGISKEFSGVNGFFVGLVSSLLLIFFVSQYVDLNWELNFMITVVWVTVSIFGSFIGSLVYRKKDISEYADKVKEKTKPIKKIKVASGIANEAKKTKISIKNNVNETKDK